MTAPVRYKEVTANVLVLLLLPHYYGLESTCYVRLQYRSTPEPFVYLLRTPNIGPF